MNDLKHLIMVLRFFNTYTVAAFLYISTSYAANAQPSPPYAPIWINQVGVSTNGSILTRTATSGSWSAAGAIASNLLNANTNGWMEFTAVIGHDYIVGLAANNLFNYTEFTQSIRIAHNSNVATAREGGTDVSLGTFQSGDIFRISREGGVVRYYKNGLPLRTVGSSQTVELKLKTTLLVPGKSTPAISTSFDSRLVVYGNVTATDGTNDSGSIVLSVSGGTSPYSFNWSSGEQTSSIQNKTRGSYTVTVIDALGRTQTRTYRIGYKVDWINLVGVTDQDTRLTKTAQNTSSGSGAISSNLLPANTNGWIEFVGLNGQNFMLGLAANNLISYQEFNNAFYLNHQNGTCVSYEGPTDVSLGNFQTGDVLRIVRAGATITYLRNDSILRTTSVNPSLELKVKASLAITGSSTPKITASFDSRLVVYGNVTATDGTSDSGSIILGVSGGALPYNFNWSSGEQTSSIQNKPRGSYTVTVTDALGRMQTRTYRIGYKVDWINLVGVTNQDTRLTKTAQNTSSGNGAISSNLLPANTNGWIEFVGHNGHNFMLGFAANNLISYQEFNNAFYLNHQNGTCVSYEGPSDVSLGNFQTGDVLRIVRAGATVSYLRNDSILRTISVSSSLELKVKASLAIAGSSTPKITASFDSRLVVYGNVTATDGTSDSGSILLGISGGASPYSFVWSSGEQTSSIQNKPRGSYTVTVTDALGRTLTRTYGIGYKVDWINLVGVTNQDTRLTKTAQNTSSGNGAISSNLLPANTNGWIEFVGVNGNNFHIGLAASNLISNQEFNNAFYLNHQNGTCLSYERSTDTSLGNFQTGDVLRISREGATVRYLRNDSILRTITVNPSLELKVKAALTITGSSTSKVTTSFDSRLVVHGTVVGLSGNTGSGSITLSVLGGTPPYYFNWSSGEQSSSINNKPRGSYTVTVVDALNRTLSRTYAIGYISNWANSVGVTNTNGRLIKLHRTPPGPVVPLVQTYYHQTQMDGLNLSE